MHARAGQQWRKGAVVDLCWLWLLMHAYALLLDSNGARGTWSSWLWFYMCRTATSTSAGTPHLFLSGCISAAGQNACMLTQLLQTSTTTMNVYVGAVAQDSSQP
jgi:hypothetical protein